jgi:hypothetical protein
MVGALDWCLILAAAAAAFGVYFGLMDQRVAQPERHILTAFLAATVFAGMFERLGGYRPKQLSRLVWQVTRVLMTWGFTVAILLLAAFMSKTSEIYSRGWAVVWIICTPMLLLIGRCLFHTAMATRAGGSYLARNIAIVGAGTEGQRLIARLREEQDKSVAICGVFDDRKSRLPASVCGFSVSGTTDDLLNFVRQKSPWLRFDVRGFGYVGTVPVFAVVDRPLKSWGTVVKWIKNRLLGSLLLVFVSPLMAVIAILIKLDRPDPVSFLRQRFNFAIQVFKFRTIHVERFDPSGARRTVRHVLDVIERATRARAFCRVWTSPRDPLTWAQPVMPGA